MWRAVVVWRLREWGRRAGGSRARALRKGTRLDARWRLSSTADSDKPPSFAWQPPCSASAASAGGHTIREAGGRFTGVSALLFCACEDDNSDSRGTVAMLVKGPAAHPRIDRRRVHRSAGDAADLEPACQVCVCVLATIQLTYFARCASPVRVLNITVGTAESPGLIAVLSFSWSSLLIAHTWHDHTGL
jgi:hypothetical protein